VEEPIVIVPDTWVPLKSIYGAAKRKRYAADVVSAKRHLATLEHKLNELCEEWAANGAWRSESAAVEASPHGSDSAAVVADALAALEEYERAHEPVDTAVRAPVEE
jgi:NADH dehydrogenase/NADH:ubiquinone oxidoreductase subunit G